jgi:hypothetical protein
LAGSRAQQIDGDDNDTTASTSSPASSRARAAVPTVVAVLRASERSSAMTFAGLRGDALTWAMSTFAKLSR